MAYSEKVIEHYEKPKNVGSLDSRSKSVGSGLVGAPECGDVMKLQIQVGDDNKIVDAKFKTFGCGSAIASSSLATEWIKGKSLEDVKKFDKDELLSELGLEHLVKTSPVRIKCALLSLKSLKYGIYSYFADKLNDSESAGNLKEEAANLY